MNHPHPPAVPSSSSSNVLPPPPTQQLSRSRSLRAIPSQVRKGLRSLSRGRSTRKSKAVNQEEQGLKEHHPQETEGPEGPPVTSDRASTSERGSNKTNRTTSEGRRDPDGKPKSSRRIKEQQQQKPQQPYRQAAKEEDAKRILELMKIATSSTKAGGGDHDDGKKAAASRGRSRSRVRGLLLGAGGRRGSNDGTITGESSCEDGAGSPGGPDRAGSSAPVMARDRGRSRSRIRQLLRMGGDGSNNSNVNKSQSRLNTSDPLGLQGSSVNGRGGQRVEPARESMRAVAALAGVPYRRDEFAKLRCSVVEDLPLEYSNHSMRAVVARNASGELTDMSTLQHPPTDLLPIRSGVLAVTAAGKLLMRTVSGLGMDDPVLLVARGNETKTADGSSDVNDGVDNHEMEDGGSDVSMASDRTATSDVNGGLDRTLFDELLLTLDRTVALRDAKANEWVRAVQESSPKSKPAVGETSPRNNFVASSSAVPDNSLLAPKLDSPRSSRALKSLLDQRSESKSHVPAVASTANNATLTRSDVEAMLASSTAPQAPEGLRQRRRPPPSQNGTEGRLMTGLVDDRDLHQSAWTGNVGRSGEPLRSASMHSMGGGTRDGDLPPSRVVVKVRVKRRSTLDAGAPLAYRIPVAPAAVVIPSSTPSSLRHRGDPSRLTGQAGADSRFDADDTSSSEAYSAVQELMSRPRLLPDMDSVFA